MTKPISESWVLNLGTSGSNTEPEDLLDVEAILILNCIEQRGEGAEYEGNGVILLSQTLT